MVANRRSDGAGPGVKLCVPLQRPAVHETIHGESVCSAHCVHNDDLFYRDSVLNGRDLLQLDLGGNKHYARSRVVQDISRLFAGEGGVNRNHDCADQQAGEICDRPLRTILRENCHSIPGGNAPFLQSARYAGDVAIELLRRNGQPTGGCAAW